MVIYNLERFVITELTMDMLEVLMAIDIKELYNLELRNRVSRTLIREK